MEEADADPDSGSDERRRPGDATAPYGGCGCCPPPHSRELKKPTPCSTTPPPLRPIPPATAVLASRASSAENCKMVQMTGTRAARSLCPAAVGGALR